MPIYEYRCTRCGHQFEVTHGVGETVDRCETCGGPARKVFSSVGIIFKGSGFHVNDYRKTPAPTERDGKGKAADGASKPDASKAGDTSKAGTDSKAGGRSSEKSTSSAASGTGAGTKSS